MQSLRFVLGPVLFAGALLFANPTVVRADDCQKRVAKADHNLHEAIEHHGWQSHQAEHWRQELAEARAYCWEHNHRWWDEDGHRWRSDHEWDDHDHDHDFDHDHH
jgi:hypothetical protein